VTLSTARTLDASRFNVTLLTRKTRGSAVLNELLGMHAAEGVLVDMCANVGAMWAGLAYNPIRCDIDARLPNLDVIAGWRDQPDFFGTGRVVTAVADPLFLSHLGKNSTYRNYATELNEFDNVDILQQVAEILVAAKTMLEPIKGTLILKVGDQVHAGERQFQWFKVLKLAEQQGWYLCDECVEDGANMPHPRRLHRYHADSQVRWLVLHTGERCPGHGLTLPGRTRCAWCGRVVACKRVRQEVYCRRPRTCRQAAYRQRKAAL